MSSAADPLPSSLVHHLALEDRRLVSPLPPLRRSSPAPIPHLPGSLAVADVELANQLRSLESKLTKETQAVWANEWLSHSSRTRRAAN